MTASVDASPYSSARPAAERSAPVHSWPALAERLLEEFPDATITDVVRELRSARDGVEQLAVDADEALEVAAAIARNQLSIVTGRVADAARLDPERHERVAGV
jgi:hypothetical protein